ncbi:MAG: HAMP domain-containing histidine kinase [Chloroflexi bacterium]|nr:HAMP domain-containing histidine kinase [Chloroflexota bacterium]
MQTQSESVCNKWFALPVVSMLALVSSAVYAGLPAYPVAGLYTLPVFLAATFFGVHGAIGSSVSSVFLLAVFGYALRGISWPDPVQIASQGVIFLVLGLLVASYRFGRSPKNDTAEDLKAKNVDLLEIVNSLTSANNSLATINDELARESARSSMVRETTIQFVGSVAHDLRTPITAVKGNAQALLRSGARLNAEVQAEMLQSIVYGANQMLNAVDNLLDASLIEAGHFVLARREASVHKLVGECTRMLAGAAGEQVIELDIAPDVPAVYADPENIAQVLLNLITNAMKYSPSRSKIVVKVRTIGEVVAVSVKDEGIGIVREDLEHIFERYYRTEDAQGSRIRGAGLGLSISRDIVRAHDGDIKVESKPGEGSTFSFTLPIFREEASSHASQTDGAGERDGGVRVA